MRRNKKGNLAAAASTYSQRRAEAIERRRTALAELTKIKAELDEMLRFFPPMNRN
jgi:hypothetical protein